MTAQKWDHKDEWRRRGNNFLVTVTRHNGTASDFDHRGPHRWAVYAYIYPNHWHFSAFDDARSSEMWQPAATTLPLHGGPSYLLRHVTESGAVTSWQVGADYDHIHDSSFTHMATAEDADSIFRDADELFDWLARPSPGVPEK